MKKHIVIALAVFLAACGDNPQPPQPLAPQMVQQCGMGTDGKPACVMVPAAPQQQAVQQPPQHGSSGVTEALAGAAVGYMVGSALSQDSTHRYYNDRDRRYYSTPQPRTTTNKTYNTYSSTSTQSYSKPAAAPSYVTPSQAKAAGAILPNQTTKLAAPISGTASRSSSINLSKSSSSSFSSSKSSSSKSSFSPRSAKK